MEKYCVRYECTTDNEEKFIDEFEVVSDGKPAPSDESIINKAIEHSTKRCRSGIAGIRIMSIE